MAGLRNISRMYGGMVVNGTRYVWDYAADDPVKESEMPLGSERHVRSERAKYALRDSGRHRNGEDPEEGLSA